MAHEKSVFAKSSLRISANLWDTLDGFYIFISEITGYIFFIKGTAANGVLSNDETDRRLEDLNP